LALGNIFQVAGDSLEVVSRFNWPIDILFIDTRHSYDDTLNNLEKWYRFVKPGGFIACHDYHEGFPGVIKAVKEFLDNHLGYKQIDLKLGVALLKNETIS
jgi:predicted O-methyltransferase YrrM